MHIFLLLLLSKKIISDILFANPSASLFNYCNKLNNNYKLKNANKIKKFLFLDKKGNFSENLVFSIDPHKKCKILSKYNINIIVLYMLFSCSPSKNTNSNIDNRIDKLIYKSNEIPEEENLIFGEKTLLNGKFNKKNAKDASVERKKIKSKKYPKINNYKKLFILNEIKKDFLYEKIKLFNSKYKDNLEKFKYLDIIYSIFIILICCEFKYLKKPKIILRSNKINKYINNKKDKSIPSVVNNSCIICLENFISEKQNDLTIMILECNHIFHETCLIKWLKDHNNCPLCRIDLLSNEKIIDF